MNMKCLQFLCAFAEEKQPPIPPIMEHSSQTWLAAIMLQTLASPLAALYVLFSFASGLWLAQDRWLKSSEPLHKSPPNPCSCQCDHARYPRNEVNISKQQCHWCSSLVWQLRHGKWKPNQIWMTAVERSYTEGELKSSYCAMQLDKVERLRLIYSLGRQPISARVA